MGVDRGKNLRNAAIVLALALAVWLVPGGEAGAGTFSNLLSVIFLGGLAFFAYRVYMEQRTTLAMFDDRVRALLYGSLALVAFAFVATGRLWQAGGLGALLWLAMLGLAGWGLMRVFRVWRSE